VDSLAEILAEILVTMNLKVENLKVVQLVQDIIELKKMSRMTTIIEKIRWKHMLMLYKYLKGTIII
jgi:hypothetical protein